MILVQYHYWEQIYELKQLYRMGAKYEISSSTNLRSILILPVMSAAKSAGNPVKQNTQNVRQQKSLGVRLCNVGALLVVLVAIAIGFFYPDESAVFATKVLVKTGATYVRLQDPPDYKGTTSPSVKFGTISFNTAHPSLENTLVRS